MKVVINKCYGGFGLSKEAIEMYAARKGLNPGVWNAKYKWFDGGELYDREIDRDDPVLVEIVEMLGEKANATFSKLQVVNIPDDVQWSVEEYDGNEWIAEVHRVWS